MSEIPDDVAPDPEGTTRTRDALDLFDEDFDDGDHGQEDDSDVMPDVPEPDHR